MLLTRVPSRGDWRWAGRTAWEGWRDGGDGLDEVGDGDGGMGYGVVHRDLSGGGTG